MPFKIGKSSTAIRFALVIFSGGLAPGSLFAEAKEEGIESLLNDSGLNLKKGREIGNGSWKKAFTVEGNRNLVLLQPKSTNSPSLHSELQQLAVLRKANIPTPLVHNSIVYVEDVPSMVIERFSFGSKQQTSEFLGLMNEESLEYLNAIDRNLFRKGYDVFDLQLLINGSGRIVVADPLGIGKRKSIDKQATNHLIRFASYKNQHWTRYLLSGDRISSSPTKQPRAKKFR